MSGKGFGKNTKKSKKRLTFPLVSSLERKLKEGVLTARTSSTWDWLQSLSETEQKYFTEIRDADTVDGTAEVILLVVHLLEMETGENKPIAEDKLQELVGVLMFMSSLKELIEVGRVEAQEFPERLSACDHPCKVRLIGGES